MYWFYIVQGSTVFVLHVAIDINQKILLVKNQMIECNGDKFF